MQGVEASAHSQHRHRTAACTPRLVVCIPVCSVMCICVCVRVCAQWVWVGVIRCCPPACVYMYVCTGGLWTGGVPSHRIFRLLPLGPHRRPLLHLSYLCTGTSIRIYMFRLLYICIYLCTYVSVYLSVNLSRDYYRFITCLFIAHLCDSFFLVSISIDMCICRQYAYASFYSIFLYSVSLALSLSLSLSPSLTHTGTHTHTHTHLEQCGHVISEQAVRKLSRAGARFKCPYCPLEVSLAGSLALTF